MANPDPLPCIRWGILGTGYISALFVKDLFVSQTDESTPVRHIIKALGTSTTEKGETFLKSLMPEGTQPPNIYTNYNDLYRDDQVDIVYVGIPHGLHKGACLGAILAKKHVLCEKPLAINSQEVDEIIFAAKKNSVYVMEGVWIRFLPIIKRLQTLIHQERVIGHVSHMYCDFSFDMKLDSLPPTSRLMDPQLGGGALLDLGVYPLTFSNIILDTRVGEEACHPEVTSSMTVVNGVDYSDAVIVNYTEKRSIGFLYTSFEINTRDEICQIQGSKGKITLLGDTPAKPTTIRIEREGKVTEIESFEHQGMGLYFEANAAALDILTGKFENEVMPLAETRRIIAIMDGIRKRGGVYYPQDPV